jgi:osmotically-inducible protein OsmY
MNQLTFASPRCEKAASLRAADIDRAAQEMLRASGYGALSAVSCTVHDDVVCLEGVLPSYYLKQVAQEIAFGVAGVRRVVNRIEVFRPAARVRQARRV